MQPSDYWLPILLENTCWSDQPANSKSISVAVTYEDSRLLIITSWSVFPPTKQESSSLNSSQKKDQANLARTSFHRCVRLSICDEATAKDHAIISKRIPCALWSSDLYVDCQAERPLLWNVSVSPMCLLPMHMPVCSIPDWTWIASQAGAVNPPKACWISQRDWKLTAEKEWNRSGKFKNWL